VKGYKFDEHGDIVPVDVYIVWGAPASGKSTYAKEHMKPGDLIVDLDLIKQSISLQEKTETDDALLPVALSIRDHIYELIERRDIECDCWVVAGLPNKDERERLARKLKTDKLIFIDATHDICIQQAMNDRSRKDKGKQRKIIDKWFKQYYCE